jgi:hypothetical protein
MARRKTVEVTCDRCDRIEYRPFEEEKGAPTPFLKAKALLLAENIDISFDDLCSPCEKTVKNLLESIAREIKGKSPKRAKKEGDDAPSQSAQVRQLPLDPEISASEDGPTSRARSKSL